MPPHPKLPSAIVLSRGVDGRVEYQDIEGNALAIGSSESLSFIPVVLVESSLVTPDYALYLFDDDENLEAKLDEIKKTERDAIILVGKQKEKAVYFVENNELISPHPKNWSYGYSSEKLNMLIPAENGKVNPENNDSTALSTVIRRIRMDNGRGNEAEITGTRMGVNVFSTSFGPCNPIVGKRKNDNQFVLHHADSAGVERDGGIGKFITSLEEGGGPDFVAVMQNSNIKRSVAKAPLLVGGIAVELREKNISRVDFPEGYNAIACVNGNTVILTGKMQFFKNSTEKQALMNEVQKHKVVETSRAIDIRDETQLVSMTTSVKEIQAMNQQMKKISHNKKAPYDDILDGLNALGATPPERPKKEGLLKKIRF